VGEAGEKPINSGTVNIAKKQAIGLPGSLLTQPVYHAFPNMSPALAENFCVAGVVKILHYLGVQAGVLKNVLGKSNRAR
jgi:hypothetical protein